MGLIDKNILVHESDFESEDISFVKIDLKLFKKVWNPFNRTIWDKVNTPITKAEIKKAIESGKLISPEDAKRKDNHSYTRAEHIQRIAWLVVNFDENHEPIQIDFGIPSICEFSFSDGNHRLAAAIYLKKDWILADPCGSVDLIESYKFKEV